MQERKRERKRERDRERERGAGPGRERKKERRKKEQDMTRHEPPCAPASSAGLLAAKAKEAKKRTRAGPKRRKGEEGGRGEKTNPETAAPES